MLLNNEWVSQKIKEKNLKIHGNKWKWKHNGSKPLGCSKSCTKREVYHNIGLPQEARKISNSLILHLKELAKEQQTKPKASRRKEIIKIRTETKDIENKNTIEHISETRRWFFEKNQ